MNEAASAISGVISNMLVALKHDTSVSTDPCRYQPSVNQGDLAHVQVKARKCLIELLEETRQIGFRDRSVGRIARTS